MQTDLLLYGAIQHETGDHISCFCGYSRAQI